MTTVEWARRVAGRAGRLTGAEAKAFALLARAAHPATGGGAVPWAELERIAGGEVGLSDLGPVSLLQAGGVVALEHAASRDDVLVYRVLVDRDPEDAAAELRGRARYWWAIRKGREHNLPTPDRLLLYVLAVDADPETGRGPLDLAEVSAYAALPKGRVRQGLGLLEHRGLLTVGDGSFRLRLAA